MTDSITLRNLTEIIDSRLFSIQSPTGITRSSRSINDCYKWKASEWKSWLLFYCLQSLLKDKYLVHLAMLSQATNILFQLYLVLKLKRYTTYSFSIFAITFKNILNLNTQSITFTYSCVQMYH